MTEGEAPSPISYARAGNLKPIDTQVQNSIKPQTVITAKADYQLQTGPQLKERLKMAQQEKQRVRKSTGESWISLGDYSDKVYTLDGFVTERRQDEKQLRGMEERLHDQIHATIETRTQNGDQNPVIVLDFGGMYGLSFLRIAKSMENLVQQGKVAFVVSNINFTPEYGLSEKGKRDHPNVKKHTEFIEANQYLVHYVRADAAELKRTSIPINGKEYSLNGHVDMIHESTTLTHTAKNDLDLPRLGNLLSPYGILYLGSRRITNDPDQTSSFNDSRQKAHGIGKTNLEKMGLQKKSTNRMLYEIYAKPLAPTSSEYSGRIIEAAKNHVVSKKNTLEFHLEEYAHRPEFEYMGRKGAWIQIYRQKDLPPEIDIVGIPYGSPANNIISTLRGDRGNDFVVVVTQTVRDKKGKITNPRTIRKFDAYRYENSPEVLIRNILQYIGLAPLPDTPLSNIITPNPE